MNGFPDLSGLLSFQGGHEPAQILARFQSVAASGLLRHALPQPFGGFGDGFAQLCLSHRRLGETSRDPGLVLMVNAHLWGLVFPLLYYGNDAQKERLLPELIQGSRLGGHAITEPGCGSDVQAMASHAERDGEGFILNGEKRYITNVPLADWLVVYAKLDGRVTGFLVDREDEGCHMSDEGRLQACRGSVTGSVLLENCRVGSERLLGKAGAGTQMMQKALELERAFVFAGIAGVMDWQLALAIRASRERRSGDAHLGRHQAISHRIAEMKLRLDTLGLWIGECARLADEGKRLTLASAQTKLYAAEAFLQSSLDAVQILGARGLEEETGLASLVQDAMAGRLFSGSSEVQKNIITALLGSGEGYRGTQIPKM